MDSVLHDMFMESTFDIWGTYYTSLYLGISCCQLLSAVLNGFVMLSRYSTSLLFGLIVKFFCMVVWFSIYSVLQFLFIRSSGLGRRTVSHFSLFLFQGKWDNPKYSNFLKEHSHALCVNRALANKAFFFMRIFVAKVDE